MKLIITLFILLSFTISSSALPTQPQPSESSNDVLAQGNPPLTRGAVRDVGAFFEWLFDARLTSTQQDELNRILIKIWQQNKRDEIKSVNQIVELRGKIAALDAEKQNSVRAAMLPEVLKGLRKEPVDDFSRLMIAVHESSNGGAANVESVVTTTTTSNKEATNNSSTRAATNAKEIFGAWRTGSVSMLQYQDRITGSTTPGRGTTFQYKFHPDGRYEFAGYMQITNYNCTTTVWNPIAGTYRVEGSKVILVPTTNKWQMRSPCYPSQNMDRDGKMDQVTYTWNTKFEDGYESLCLTAADGGKTCYRKEK